MKECRESNFVRLPVTRREENSEMCRAALGLRQGEIEVRRGGQRCVSHQLLQTWLEPELLDNLVGWQ